MLNFLRIPAWRAIKGLEKQSPCNLHWLPRKIICWQRPDCLFRVLAPLPQGVELNPGPISGIASKIESNCLIASGSMVGPGGHFETAFRNRFWFKSITWTESLMQFIDQLDNSFSCHWSRGFNLRSTTVGVFHGNFNIAQSIADESVLIFNMNDDSFILSLDFDLN